MTTDKVDTKTTAMVPVTGVEGLEKMAEYEGTGGVYEIYGVKTEDGFAPLVETEIWRLFVAKTPTGQIGLMKVNRPEDDGSNFIALERETRILRTLQTVASQVDAETEGSNKPFHGANFPVVLETLEPEEGKLVVFLGYHPSISTYRQLLPLSRATASARVDMQTATWMFGKLLKSLAFVHGLGFSAGFVDASNVFIETDVHGVVVLDLTSTNEDASEAEQLAEVAAVARIVWVAVGGTDETEPPHDKDIMSVAAHAEFVSHLRRMMDSKTDGAAAEHTMIYTPDVGLADRTWPKIPISDGSGMKRQFHAFVTYLR